MAVKKVGGKYRCNVCGNEVTVTGAGGGTPVLLRSGYGID
ncbi:MAG: desulforedoxin [Dehalococcoidia bacterium]|nr:desulforedoxin [Dehalococcoidia bacterium]